MLRRIVLGVPQRDPKDTARHVRLKGRHRSRFEVDPRSYTAQEADFAAEIWRCAGVTSCWLPAVPGGHDLRVHR